MTSAEVTDLKSVTSKRIVAAMFMLSGFLLASLLLMEPLRHQRGNTARASRLPALALHDPAPAGSTWVASDASSCNRRLPDELALDRPNSLDYTGTTPGDLLEDAARYGARFRKVALTPDRRIVATTTWCEPPVPEALPATRTAQRGLLYRCGCETAADARDPSPVESAPQ